MRTLRSLSSLCVQVCLKCKYLTVELLGQRENASVRSTQVVKCPQRSGIVLYYQHVPVPFSLRPHHQSMCERLILIFAVQCFLCKKLFFSISCLYNPCHLQLYSKMAPQNKNMDIEKKKFSICVYAAKQKRTKSVFRNIRARKSFRIWSSSFKADSALGLCFHIQLFHIQHIPAFFFNNSRRTPEN